MSIFFYVLHRIGIVNAVFILFPKKLEQDIQ